MKSRSRQAQLNSITRFVYQNWRDGWKILSPRFVDLDLSTEKTSFRNQKYLTFQFPDLKHLDVGTLHHINGSMSVTQFFYHHVCKIRMIPLMWYPLGAFTLLTSRFLKSRHLDPTIYTWLHYQLRNWLVVRMCDHRLQCMHSCMQRMQYAWGPRISIHVSKSARS